MRQTIFIFLTIFCFVSCSSEGKRIFKRKQQSVYTPSIVNLASLLSEEENYISFPNWFNDSIIVSHNINRIVRKSYLKMDDLENEVQINFIPREIKEYSFTEKGMISKLVIRNFYDEKEIGSHIYSFGNNKDENEYCDTKLQHFFYAGIENEEEDESFGESTASNPYKIFDKSEEIKGLKKYQNVETGDYLYYIISQKYWGALSVDSLISPTPKDEVVLGSQIHIYKKYQVSNKINEFNVRTYQYDQKIKAKLLNWEANNYPFKQKRDFLYSKNGVCYAYIDSIFSNDEFVTRTSSKIYFNKLKEPVRITHLKSNENGDTLFISKDVFEYFRK